MILQSKIYLRLGRLAACRDEKLMNVNNVNVFDEERTWVSRFTCEIVFQPDTDAPLCCSTRGVEFTS